MTTICVRTYYCGLRNGRALHIFHFNFECPQLELPQSELPQSELPLPNSAQKSNLVYLKSNCISDEDSNDQAEQWIAFIAASLNNSCKCAYEWRNEFISKDINVGKECTCDGIHIPCNSTEYKSFNSPMILYDVAAEKFIDSFIGRGYLDQYNEFNFIAKKSPNPFDGNTYNPPLVQLKESPSDIDGASRGNDSTSSSKDSRFTKILDHRPVSTMIIPNLSAIKASTVTDQPQPENDLKSSSTENPSSGSTYSSCCIV